MLLRNRIPGIDSAPISAAPGYEHLPESAIALLRWLNTAEINFVLVGPVARLIRGYEDAAGPVSVVPAPYGRNLERLSRALIAAQARARSNAHLAGVMPHLIDASPVKLEMEQLVGPGRWELCCGAHDLDVEGRPFGVPSYQELLFETVRVDVAPEVPIEVAGPEHIELYAHIARTGRAPEIVVSRGASSEAA